MSRKTEQEIVMTCPISLFLKHKKEWKKNTTIELKTEK